MSQTDANIRITDANIRMNANNTNKEINNKIAGCRFSLVLLVSIRILASG